MWVTSSTAKALTPTAIALGNFDGVHRGHQRVIEPILNFACDSQIEEREMRSACNALATLTSSGADSESVGAVSEISPQLQQHIYPTVVTFNPHPREFFSGERLKLLTPLDEKVIQLASLGVEQLVLLPFDRELAALSPEEFVEKILVEQLACQQISVGQDFRFGYKRSGTAAHLQAIAATKNIPVTIVPLHSCVGVSLPEADRDVNQPPLRISSSDIRASLEQGNVKRANQLLGRPYTLVGKIVKGQQLGRTIGFPTANIQLPAEKFLPRQGVYAVRVFSPELHEAQGVMNIGDRPTVNGTHPTVEVHLLNWSGDLYEKSITVQLEKFLRPEQKFPSLEALKTQIQADCTAAQESL